MTDRIGAPSGSDPLRGLVSEKSLNESNENPKTKLITSGANRLSLGAENKAKNTTSDNCLFRDAVKPVSRSAVEVSLVTVEVATEKHGDTFTAPVGGALGNKTTVDTSLD